MTGREPVEAAPDAQARPRPDDEARAADGAAPRPNGPVSGTIILRPAGELGEDPSAPLPTIVVPPDRRRVRVPWRAVLVVLGALLGGLAAFWPHHDAWVGHNGDHYYYASTALQYAGVPYEESLSTATAAFGYPYDATQLDLGYLDPAVAPLIYPRVVLGLVSWPAVSALGVDGVWSGGLVCGGLAVVLLVLLARRVLGTGGALALPALLGTTRYAPEYMAGIYQESAVILATVLMLATFPLGAARRRPAHALAAAGLVPLILLSRQVPLLPIGMVVGGWLWAAVGSRSLRNPWLPYVATVVPTTVVTYLATARWAPYDALPFLYEKTGSSSVGELLSRGPALWQDSLGVDAAAVWADDRALVVLAGLSVFGWLATLRNPVAGVHLGGLASGVVTLLLNGQPNGFRYLATSLPTVALLAAFAVSGAVVGVLGLAGRDVEGWPGRLLTRSEPRREAGKVHVSADGRVHIIRPKGLGPLPSRRASGAAAGAAWAVAAALVVGATLVHRPAPLDSARQISLTSATFGHEWPFSVSEGTLVCAGNDYQMWFVTPDGTTYALSGTAMAASMTAPRALDLAPGPIAYAWPQIKPMLTEGLRLCGAGRDFQQPRKPPGGTERGAPTPTGPGSEPVQTAPDTSAVTR